MFSNLDTKTIVSGLRDVLKEKLGQKNGFDDFKSYAYGKYGKTIADLFLINYSEKLWGVPANRLSPSIAGSRLKNLNIRTFIADTLKTNQRAKHLEGSFYYPKQGFGRITKKIADECGNENIKCDENILEIGHQFNNITYIKTNNQIYLHPDYVISSLPLKVFLEIMNPLPPPGILSIASSLKFRSILLIGILLNKASINNAATMYFPDEKYLFNRVYEPRNRSLYMAPPGKTSLIVEVPYFDGDLIEGYRVSELKQQVIHQLIDCGFFTSSDIIESFTTRLKNAYPVLEKGFDEKVKSLEHYLDNFTNLSLTGRNGKFVYSWLHNMMRYGKDIIDSLTEIHINKSILL
jgi:protoporphyrinogen oxidase